MNATGNVPMPKTSANNPTVIKAYCLNRRQGVLRGFFNGKSISPLRGKSKCKRVALHFSYFCLLIFAFCLLIFFIHTSAPPAGPPSSPAALESSTPATQQQSGARRPTRLPKDRAPRGLARQRPAHARWRQPRQDRFRRPVRLEISPYPIRAKEHHAFARPGRHGFQSHSCAERQSLT